jgi:hypothetical protein
VEKHSADAHLLLEVIPNGLTGNVSNPRVVYVFRWIAGRHPDIPNFEPLYTIELAFTRII